MLLIDKNKKISLAEQIYNGIKEQIIKGEYSLNHKLPSTRLLSKELQVSRNTINSAYAQLELEGYIYSKIGAGFYVKNIPHLSMYSKVEISHKASLKKSEENFNYDFKYGNIDLNIYKTKSFHKCLMEAIHNEEMETNQNYSSANGLDILREVLVKYLHYSRGVNTTADKIIITGGFHNSIKLISEIFSNNIFNFAIEEPGYSAARDVFMEANYKIFPIHLEKDGVSLKDILKLKNSLLYITPSHQFPYGSVLPIDKRIALLDWANKTNSYIIEDDYDSELWYSDMPIPSIQSIDKNNCVIYLGTFSKILSPDLRLSYIILPDTIDLNYNEKYSFFSSFTPDIIQKAVAFYIQKGELQKRINILKTNFSKKHKMIIDFINKYCQNKIEIYGKGGGMHFILKLKTTLKQEEIIKIFSKEKIGVYPTKIFWLDKNKCDENEILIGYGGISLVSLPVYLATMKKVLDIIFFSVKRF